MKRADSGKNLPLSAASNTGAQRPRIAPLPNRMYYNKNKVNGAFYALKNQVWANFLRETGIPRQNIKQRLFSLVSSFRRYWMFTKLPGIYYFDFNTKTVRR
ncbi:MAG: hypothetical protein K9L79_05720 [Methylobacter tundripaludum]|nr:hypothetical protein [Methylobacter tundripaludum]